jgi:large conductance mechanosensitive channel
MHKENAMSLIKEFKAFAMRGNVMDMAVGIIIGGAFGKIVSSLVSDVLMPPLGLLMGKVDFKDLAITLKAAVVDETGKETAAAVMLRYGVFIDNIISFLIVAFAVFMLIKAINSLHKKEAATPAAPPAPTRQEVLLGEIRDLLAKR